jgi:hypothetical protein
MGSKGYANAAGQWSPGILIRRLALALLVVLAGCDAMDGLTGLPEREPYPEALRYGVTWEADGILPDTVRIIVSSRDLPVHWELRLGVAGVTRVIKTGASYEVHAWEWTIEYNSRNAEISSVVWTSTDTLAFEVKP